MRHKDILALLYGLGYKQGIFTLRSGKTSDVYFDKYSVFSNVEISSIIVKSLCELIKWKCNGVANLPDYFGFLEMGALPLSLLMMTFFDTRLPPKCLYIRKKEKEYGRHRAIEGDYASLQGKDVALIEDVVTTGGALIDAATKLRLKGATVEDVYCIVFRGSDELLRNNGLDLRYLYTLEEIEQVGKRLR